MNLGKSIVFFTVVFLLINSVKLLPVLLHSKEDTAGKIIQSISMSNGTFSGVLHNNESNRKRQGAGFNPLIHSLYPGQNIFGDGGVGLNFEHIMNGAAADADICMFTPRKDICSVFRHSDFSASVIHKAQNSTWNMDSEMKYTFSGEHYIDLEFKVTCRENRFPLGYVAFMWASYMNRTFSRQIHFWGRENGEEKWVTFGEDTEKGFETGTISCYDVENLPYEEGTKTLNIIEHPDKKFILPFYYGFVHGSGNVNCQADTMVYIMMFDKKESIRFAMWNFQRNSEGKPDTFSPAWDWQFVIQEPQLDREYSYKARVVYKPFAGRENVRQEYENWITGLKN